MGWRATWLADAFRAEGCVVIEVEGWKERGYDFPDSPAEEGVSIFHHTASSQASGPAGGLRIVTYGRPGLDGPIANWLTARNGIIYVIAAGVSNNAGTGNARAAGLPTVTGNSNTLANEMENDGKGEPFPLVQRTAALKTHAAVHKRMGWPASRGIGHLEWSTTGKPDPYRPTWGDMAATRAQLAALIEGDNDMFTDDDRAMLKNTHGRAAEVYPLKAALLGLVAAFNAFVKAEQADDLEREQAVAHLQAQLADVRHLVTEIPGSDPAALARDIAANLPKEQARALVEELTRELAD